jgi:hypothetical protein
MVDSASGSRCKFIFVPFFQATNGYGSYVLTDGTSYRYFGLGISLIAILPRYGEDKELTEAYQKDLWE